MGSYFQNDEKVAENSFHAHTQLVQIMIFFLFVFIKITEFPLGMNV